MYVIHKNKDTNEDEIRNMIFLNHILDMNLLEKKVIIV